MFAPRFALLPLVLGLLAAGTGCLNVSPPAVSFASEPPGARVRVDGKDSGWVTPCLIALDEEEEHVVTLTLDGHGPREVRLVPVERLGVISWYQAVNGVRSTIRFPLLQPTEDLLLPLRPAEALAPGRVFVRLRPEAAE